MNNKNNYIEQEEDEIEEEIDPEDLDIQEETLFIPDPTETQLKEYAEELGFDLHKHPDSINIAYETWKTKLPENWKRSIYKKTGELLYINLLDQTIHTLSPIEEQAQDKYKLMEEQSLKNHQLKPITKPKSLPPLSNEDIKLNQKSKSKQKELEFLYQAEIKSMNKTKDTNTSELNSSKQFNQQENSKNKIDNLNLNAKSSKPNEDKQINNSNSQNNIPNSQINHANKQNLAIQQTNQANIMKTIQTEKLESSNVNHSRKRSRDHNSLFNKKSKLQDEKIKEFEEYKAKLESSIKLKKQKKYEEVKETLIETIKDKKNKYENKFEKDLNKATQAKKLILENSLKTEISLFKSNYKKSIINEE